MPVTRDRPVVIAGAGIAGLSQALALLDADYRGEIVLVDRRREWTRDRTWCTWLTQPTRFAELATATWPSWRLAWGEREVVRCAPGHPYICLDAGRVYDAALARLDGHPRVQIRAGEAVRELGHGSHGPWVRTDRETIEAAVVFDARGLAGRGGASPRGESVVRQRFLGWEVETDMPLFAGAVATLMDFRPAGGDGVCFLYVLPLSPTRALVEHTTIGLRSVPVAARRTAIEAELHRRGAQGWQVRHEERGSLPMCVSPAPSHGGLVCAIGAAGGAIRASSGYAYSRIQRQVDLTAAAVVAGREPPHAPFSTRLAGLDAVFLRALRERPCPPEELFLRTAAAMPAGAFARFMTDAGSAADELAAIAALPPLTMAGVALKSVAGALTARLRPA